MKQNTETNTEIEHEAKHTSRHVYLLLTESSGRNSPSDAQRSLWRLRSEVMNDAMRRSTWPHKQHAHNQNRNRNTTGKADLILQSRVSVNEGNEQPVQRSEAVTRALADRNALVANEDGHGGHELGQHVENHVGVEHGTHAWFVHVRVCERVCVK